MHASFRRAAAAAPCILVFSDNDAHCHLLDRMFPWIPIDLYVTQRVELPWVPEIDLYSQR